MLTPTATFTIPVHPSTVGWDVQKLVVEKHCFHAPQAATSKLALVVSHSNGFNRQTLHPMIRRIVEGIHQQTAYQRTDLCVFAWDARNHGDSALLNRGTFSDHYTWFDNALDTKQIVDHFELDEYDGIIGVGHSFGATSMVLVEHMYPGTFTGLCCIEPVLAPMIMPTEARAQLPVLASLKRRDTWPNRDACFKSLNGRGFWKTFDPEVLQLYVDTALYDTPEGTVMLKTPKEQEYHVFAAGYYPNNIGYHAVRGVTVPIHFVYAEDSTYVAFDPMELPAMNPKLVTCDVVPGSHMVPNEKPADMVPHVLKVMDRALQHLRPTARL
ncbi:Alpha/Beta hydrolase protein [Gongronella butleri]|nr:Alpha/Beta hydrolase protein [Gongronella butleri]